MLWSDLNYTQKRFPLRKLTGTKEESLVATFSSWRNQQKQVVSGLKMSFCRLDRLIHSSFKWIIHYPVAKGRLVFGFKTPLCRPYRTHTFWETKMIKHQISAPDFTFFCNVQLELWKGTLTWNKKSHAQNQEKYILKIVFRDISSVNNPIQTAAFFET